MEEIFSSFSNIDESEIVRKCNQNNPIKGIENKLFLSNYINFARYWFYGAYDS